MRKSVIVAGVIIGAAVALFWLRIVAAMTYGIALSPAWYGVMFLSCPAIWLLQFHWWLAPVVNGAIYGGLAWKLMRLRRVSRAL